MIHIPALFKKIFGATFDPSLRAEVRKEMLRQAVERTVLLSNILAVVFASYGISSFDFINRFDPSVSLWSNFWPRLLFQSLPFLLLGRFLKGLKISDESRILLWTVSFAVLMQIAGWIYVWKLALNGNPEIILYVSSGNAALFVAVYPFITPPPKILLWSISALLAIFVVPLYWVTIKSGDPIVAKFVIMDALLLLLSVFFFSLFMHNLRAKIVLNEIENTQNAKKFLSPIVAEAIYEKKKHLLESQKKKAFIMSIDIRDSTELQKMDHKRFLEFRKEFFDLVSECSRRNNGSIQKTVGDGHVLNFGLYDNTPDLSDIPGLGMDVAMADDRRLANASKTIFAFSDQLFEGFHQLAYRHYPEISVRIGAGIDKGLVERRIQSVGASLELDVNGDPVNCSNRLQEFTKQVRTRFDADASLLVVSPFASDYLKDLTAFSRVQTIERDLQVRNYSLIKWVLVREYPSLHSAHRKSKAA